MRNQFRLSFGLLIMTLLVFFSIAASCQILTIADKPAQLDVLVAGEHSIRVMLHPVSADDTKGEISLRVVNKSLKKKIGNLYIEILPAPLTMVVSNILGQAIQKIVFQDDGNLSFAISGSVLGMGEGGPRPARGADWRNLPVEFDRRGRWHKMQPRWQGDAYGSRNPVPLLIGTEGWGIFVAAPWVEVDMTGSDRGIFIPLKRTDITGPQNETNQGQDLGKGLPPIKEAQASTGSFDFYIFDAHVPGDLMKDLSKISGPSVMPPKWSLGYMQSHRTLKDENQMIEIVDTFRAKKIPVDAVIYLGTGFCPRGWNAPQPSFDFNPLVFKRDPKIVISDIHQRNVKMIVHIVPWDRDKLPTLQGTIPSKPGEIIDDSHISTYWKQHVNLVKAGIDGFWPDEGDWFDLAERIKRHQLYYQGPLSTQPDVRPWSLHRNGYLGIAQWGGWVWSGDTESSWKTLEAQVAVGLNHSLSLSPYWGSDIGGFYPNPEKTGELYARWFQFGAFCPSFRSHGRTWQTALPWGWGLPDMGVREGSNDNSSNPYGQNPLPSEMNNSAIEPVCKKYAELRYQLLPYNYTLAWEARNSGMPFMRALWLHYPEDKNVEHLGSEYLWGRDLLIAPIFTKGATTRNIYLPKGDWYDWWTNKKHPGGQTITRAVDLSTMPIYVRAGAIIPIDPIRQYTGEVVTEPTTITVFQGADGAYTLYEDDGISQQYLAGNSTLTKFVWDNSRKQITIEPESGQVKERRSFIVKLLPDGVTKSVEYLGQRVVTQF